MLSEHDNPIDQTNQRLVIKALSSEFGVPIEDMTAVYEEQRAVIEADAKVKDYIPILRRCKTRYFEPYAKYPPRHGVWSERPLLAFSTGVVPTL